jgi:sigma-B regulation protein RsbU (phosphoserine phosphatase)
MSVELPIHELRADVVGLVAATFIGSLAVAALALYLLRRRSADVTPLAFASFALLYAVRLAGETQVFRAALPSTGGRATWRYIVAALTYAILPAGAWMGESLLGHGWRGTLKFLRTIAVVTAPIAIAGMFAIGPPEWLMPLNNLLVLALLAAIGAAVVQHTPDASTVLVRVGVSVAAAIVAAENLRSLGLIRWPPGFEFVGILCFVVAMAFAVADRFLAREGRLAAVDRELATARRIQQALLPERVPQTSRFRIDVKYVPMTAVAGDFYDFLDVDESRSTVFLADVSGHGVPAALIASMVKVAAASHRGQASDPGALLSAVSRTLDGHLGQQFLTAVCVHLDGERGQVRYAGAGHPPVLHWASVEQTLKVLASDGMLIGLMPSDYVSRTVTVHPGDRLFVYTDGVLEAANNEGTFFGDARFYDVIRENATGSSGELADLIVREITRWSGSPAGFADDLTLLVIEVQ